MKKFIDLTMPLSEQTRVYPGDPAPSIKKVADFSDKGYYDSFVSFDVHTGTHLDAPKHFVQGGHALDSYPLQRFVCRGVLIKAVGEKTIGKELFQTHEILHGDAVLIWTQHSDKAHFKDYFETNPVISTEAAQYLVSKKASLVGIDSFSVDNPPFETHKTLLGADVLVLENLANLASLAGKEFKLFALPAKIAGAEAAPCRAVAELYDNSR